MSARTQTLARLQDDIARLETRMVSDVARIPLGHQVTDQALNGGLAQGAVHEIYAADGRQHAAATGFVLGLMQRVTAPSRTALWVRQDFAAQDAGELSMSGFAAIGFDPRRLIVVRAADAQMALRVTVEALACNALGAVVTEICGAPRAFDLAASRRLTLAAAQSRVTGLMLHHNALMQPSAAETRWIVRAARSPPVAEWEAWGAPILDVELARNRHGPTGRWIMKWTCDDNRFGEHTAFGEQTHSQPAAAAPVHGSHQPPRRRDASPVRRAG
jgi:protein ImuA